MVSLRGFKRLKVSREGVVVLMNYVCHSAKIDFLCVSSRTYELSLGFQGLKCVYGGVWPH